MWSNLAMGFLMMLVTTLVHAGFMVLTMHRLAAHEQNPNRATTLHSLGMVGFTVLVLFAASLVEVSIYAAVYVALGAISGMEPALYFSTVTFTTLGYGDVVLDPRWRLLASFEAANGIIMFGWTTAIVVAAVQRVYATARR
jgi:Ion channel